MELLKERRETRDATSIRRYGLCKYHAIPFRDEYYPTIIFSVASFSSSFLLFCSLHMHIVYSLDLIAASVQGRTGPKREPIIIPEHDFTEDCLGFEAHGMATSLAFQVE
jgi:hypothetical protein